MSKSRHANNENYGYGSSRRGSKRKVSEFSNFTNSTNSNSGYNGAYSGSLGSTTTAGNSKRRGGVNDLSRLEKMVPVCFPNDHPFNKDG
jgi:hypothetical protein